MNENSKIINEFLKKEKEKEKMLVNLKHHKLFFGRHKLMCNIFIILDI